MSHVVMDGAYGRLLRIHTTTGVCGLGEIAYAGTLSSEDRHTVVAREPDYLTPLIGQEVEALGRLAEQLRKEGKTTRGVAFGLEVGLLDIQARRQNKSVTDLLGGAAAESVADYFSISERSIARIHTRIKLAGAARAVIQLKLGIGSVKQDIAQITASLEVMNKRQLLLADANGGWTVDTACAVISSFDDERILWEEPCNNYADNVQVAHSSGRPVMFDQCISDADLAVRAVDEGIAAAVCIKPAFLGGMVIAKDLRDRCARASVKMRIDGPWCGDIACAAILHLAVGAPPELLIAGCDLREPLVIDTDLRGVVRVGDTRIAPPPGVGLGVNPSETALGEPVAVYQ